MARRAYSVVWESIPDLHILNGVIWNPPSPPVHLRGMADCRIWIDEGCIQCGWCQTLDDRVFAVGPTGTVIRGDVRSDGRTDANRDARATLRQDVLDAAALGYLQFIADGCPVRVIRIADDLTNSIDPVSGLARICA